MNRVEPGNDPDTSDAEAHRDRTREPRQDQADG